jgi:hypothetical protein
VSNYNNFLKEFPDRCKTILKRYSEQAQKDDVEVTLMLSIAAAGFVVAFEGLRDKKSLLGDPSHKYPQAWKSFDELLGDRFYSSTKLTVDGKWELVQKHNTTEPPWNNGNLVGDYPSPKEKSMFYILDILRNSLAHGNIRTCSDELGQINTLVFIVWSRKYFEKNEPNNYDKSKYDLLAVSEKDFRNFLANWLTFLEKLNYFEQD